MTSPTSISDALAALSMDDELCPLEELLSSSTKVLVRTASFLDHKALVHLGATCHDFRSIVLDDIDSQWQNLYAKLWPNHQIKFDEGEWRDEFTTRSTIQSLQLSEYAQSTSVIASREAIINTLVASHDQLKLDPDILYLSVSILERYMAKRESRNLKVISGLWVAANVRQGGDTLDGDLDVDEFARIGSCTTQEILDQEKIIQEDLEPNLTFPHHTSS